MAISKTDILKVAHLARINLSEQELEMFSGQLDSIIGFIDKLKKSDTSSVKPTSHTLEIQNVSRPDERGASLSQEDALKNAPLKAKGHFQVPKIIE